MTPIDPKNKNVLLATALAAGSTSAAAATQLKISPCTVKRRLADPSFRNLVANIRANMVETILGRITERLARATDAVAEMLDSPEPLMRFRAARLLFHTMCRLRTAVDVDRQIREL